MPPLPPNSLNLLLARMSTRGGTTGRHYIDHTRSREADGVLHGRPQLGQGQIDRSVNDLPPLSVHEIGLHVHFPALTASTGALRREPGFNLPPADIMPSPAPAAMFDLRPPGMQHPFAHLPPPGMNMPPSTNPDPPHPNYPPALAANPTPPPLIPPPTRSRESRSAELGEAADGEDRMDLSFDD